MLIPYEIETLYQRHSIANWIIIGLTVAVFVLGERLNWLSEDAVEMMVLQDWSATGLVGYLFLHAGWIHLIGNMVFLWVFGNAICSNTNNFIYPVLYLVLGVLAGCVHVLFGGGMAVGASGAVNGIIGIALAMYPLNRVHVFWIFAIRGGLSDFPVWGLACFWFLFDIWGAVMGKASVAYWAHIGGLLAGVAMGLIALQLRWVEVTEDDNRTLLEILKGEQRD